MFSDADIEERLERGDLVIEGMESPAVQIQPASVDLRLARQFKTFKRVGRPLSFAEDMNEHMQTHSQLDIGREFELKPKEFALATTIERVKIPHDVVARVEGRSSLGRVGLLIHATAGFIDPGFEGQITLELFNLNLNPIILEPGMRICQMSFQKLATVANRPYGSDRGSKYQNQKGATASRLHRDLKTHG
jgi:dCTP deaminase